MIQGLLCVFQTAEQTPTNSITFNRLYWHDTSYVLPKCNQNYGGKNKEGNQQKCLNNNIKSVQQDR